MSELGKYIDGALEDYILPMTSDAEVVIAGRSVRGVVNSTSHSEEVDVGGFDPRDSASVTVRTADLPRGPRHGELVTVNGTKWRISDYDRGEAATTLHLVNPDARNGG